MAPVTVQSPPKPRPPSWAPAPPRPRQAAPPRERRWQLPLICGAISLVLGALLLAYGPPGVDRAAHLYHETQFERYGWQFWNNNWYAGRYELLNSSVLFYPLAVYLGNAVMILGSVAGTSALFAPLARQVSPRGGAAAAVAFAITWPAVIVAGQYPFALGTLCSIAAVLAFCRRRAIGIVAALLALLASPLAFLLLSVLLCGMALSARHMVASRRMRLAAAGMVGLVGLEALVLRVFPMEGRFAFPWLDLVAILLLCGLGLVYSWRNAPLRGLFGAYAVVGIAFFVFPSGVGGNAARLAHYFALPLLILAVTRRKDGPRRLVPVVLCVAAVAQMIPFARNLEGGLDERANRATFWAGAVSFLRAHGDPNHRVEAVATWGHWESYYLSRDDIPITRGWFRQDDFPLNNPLYAGSLDIATYKDWLRSLAVRYVVVPNDELDYSSRKEAEILHARNKPGLQLVYRDANVDILQLVDPTPLLTTVVAATPNAIPGDAPAVQLSQPAAFALWLPAPGLYEFRIRYTPYWQTGDPGVCAAPDPGTGMTRIVANHGGPVRLSFDLSLGKTTKQALGAAAQCSYTQVTGLVPR